MLNQSETAGLDAPPDPTEKRNEPSRGGLLPLAEAETQPRAGKVGIWPTFLQYQEKWIPPSDFQVTKRFHAATHGFRKQLEL